MARGKALRSLRRRMPSPHVLLEGPGHGNQARARRCWAAGGGGGGRLGGGRPPPLQYPPPLLYPTHASDACRCCRCWDTWLRRAPRRGSRWSAPASSPCRWGWHAPLPARLLLQKQRLPAAAWSSRSSSRRRRRGRRRRGSRRRRLCAGMSVQRCSRAQQTPTRTTAAPQGESCTACGRSPPPPGAPCLQSSSLTPRPAHPRPRTSPSPPPSRLPLPLTRRRCSARRTRRPPSWAPCCSSCGSSTLSWLRCWTRRRRRADAPPTPRRRSCQGGHHRRQQQRLQRCPRSTHHHLVLGLAGSSSSSSSWRSNSSSCRAPCGRSTRRLQAPG